MISAYYHESSLAFTNKCLADTTKKTIEAKNERLTSRLSKNPEFNIQRLKKVADDLQVKESARFRGGIVLTPESEITRDLTNVECCQRYYELMMTLP